MSKYHARALAASALIATLGAFALGLQSSARGLPTLRAIERGEGDGPLVVLLHGYGSRPEDVVSVADRTDLPIGTRFAFPYAPEPTRPPYGPIGGGFMWWPFTTDLRDLRTTHLGGLVPARERVLAFLDSEQERLGIDSDRIVLGGFSQGAILALDVALHDDRPLAGLMLLSGTLVDQAELTPHIASRRGLRVYVSHGTADTVLPYEHTSELVSLLREGGVDVRLRTFDGGHVVPPIVGSDMAEFIADVTR
jgi:phospholipase/carboxylesterase